MPRTFLSACFLVFALASSGILFAEDKAGGPLTFEKHVWPILKTHCFNCHGESTDREGKFDVRLRRLMVAGGESGTGR